MSEDGQKIISANKYIEVANSGAFTSTNPKGKIVVAGSSSVTPVMENLSRHTRQSTQTLTSSFRRAIQQQVSHQHQMEHAT